jgi:hypothetical protein
MLTKDDLRLVLAYFNLRSPVRYYPDEIASRRTIRLQFLQLARQIVGDVPAKEIIRLLASLGNAARGNPRGRK